MQSVQQVIEALPEQFHGPGGAIAVLKNGEVIGQHVWGFANLEQRIPMTVDTEFPLCSISKQMVCAVLKSIEQTPSASMQRNNLSTGALSTAIKKLLPGLGGQFSITVDDLCNNQSGIRDYWALTTLWGGHPEGHFSLNEDAPQMLRLIKSLHFQPGSQYAYANTNFHILARAIELVSGQKIAELLAERVFAPAGMATASFCENTAQHLGHCRGYEGDANTGYVPACNAVEWSGDAGVVASLRDMIAYEQYLDAQWPDQNSVYRALAKQPHFVDGSPATYGNGLSHLSIGSTKALGHGGALRGLRLQRVHVPSERLSVVVMFNHQADAYAAADHLLRVILDQPMASISSEAASLSWFGHYLDPVSRLAITVSPVDTGEISITYAGHAEHLRLSAPHRAQSHEMDAELSGDQLLIHRIEDHQVIRADRLSSASLAAAQACLAGEFRCAEIESTLRIYDYGNVSYAAFDGYLGQGPGQILRHLEGDVWLIKCPRGMDAPAPGDWTLLVHRDANKEISGLTIGCWLARTLTYLPQ